MKWLILAARAATALIPALVVYFLGTVLSHSSLPPWGGGPGSVWVPTLVAFFVVFFGIPIMAKIGNLNRKPAPPSPRERFIMVLLIFLAVIAAAVVVPCIYLVEHVAQVAR